MQTKGLAYHLQGSVPGRVGVKPCLLEANPVHCGVGASCYTCLAIGGGYFGRVTKRVDMAAI